MIRKVFLWKIITTLKLSLHQIFIFLLGHLHFFLYFFLTVTLMENLFKKHPITFCIILVDLHRLCGENVDGDRGAVRGRTRSFDFHFTRPYDTRMYEHTWQKESRMRFGVDAKVIRETLKTTTLPY